MRRSSLLRRFSLLGSFAAFATFIVACRPADERSAEPNPATPQAGMLTAADSVVPYLLHPTNAADSALVSSLTITVHKTPTCGCCSKWVDHMKEFGFKVVAVDHATVDPIKDSLGVHQPLRSCHTTVVGDYVVEGHVPAEDVLKMLREKPAIVGLAAPGMPMGSPGMEGPTRDRFDVVSFDKSGKTEVYVRR